jgi:UDP-N-acetylmuramoyl-L-alanyl-D-glutamate--2,6-diaminopimelate ligase
MKMRLQHIIDGVEILQSQGQLDREIEQLHFDSRLIGEGDIYFAQKGTRVDGHDFIAQAIAAGASVVVVENLPAELLETITYLKVGNVAYCMGLMAANYYGHPTQKLKLVGVTGTNGKTTTVNLLYHTFRKLGGKCGLISTIGNYIEGKEVKATHTTPDVITLNRLLAEMAEAGCDYCFMEVSSHAVAQLRIAGLKFHIAVFTNITHDHLDYHGTFQNYLQAKKAFFDGLDEAAWALSNKDDRNGSVMLQNTKATKKYYALKQMADFKARLIEKSFEGLNLQIDQKEVHVSLVGEFNAYNVLAVFGVCRLLDFESMEILTALSTAKSVAGRFEFQEYHQRYGIVDYAHTPDALKNVLETIAAIRSGSEQLITVVGCGGDRDKTKRPLMAEVACKWSDRVILTSDNPRTEAPEAIIKDMEAGVPIARRSKVLSIANRREAIRTATNLSQEGDIILVAGKGHETYQEVHGQRNHFDDREELSNAFQELKPNQA